MNQRPSAPTDGEPGIFPENRIVIALGRPGSDPAWDEARGDGPGLGRFTLVLPAVDQETALATGGKHRRPARVDQTSDLPVDDAVEPRPIDDPAGVPNPPDLTSSSLFADLADLSDVHPVGRDGQARSEADDGTYEPYGEAYEPDDEWDDWFGTDEDERSPIGSSGLHHRRTHLPDPEPELDDDPAGRPRPVRTGPAPHEVSRPPKLGRRRWPLIAVAVVFGASLAIPVAAAVLSSGSTARPAADTAADPAPSPTRSAASPSSTPTGAGSRTAAGAGSDGAASATQAPVAAPADLLAWVAKSLPRRAVVLADPVTAATLRGLGFPQARGVAEEDQLPPTAGYLIDVARSAPADAAHQAMLNRSVPLAVFGPAGSTSSVRALFASPAEADQRQQADAELRRQGGQQLAENGNIHADADTAALLRVGLIDVRVQSALIVLARSGEISISHSAADPAEDLAGRPVRSVVVTGTDAQALQAELDDLPADEQPDFSQFVSDQALKLTWYPAVATTPLGG